MYRLLPGLLSSNVCLRSPAAALHRVPNLRPLDADQLLQHYEDTKRWLRGKKPPTNVNPSGVFANDEVNLAKIDVYGFDYDYTLATYMDIVEDLIHELSKNILVDQFKYPEEIRNMPYDSKSVIRGLHYDVQKGLLLKLDTFARIEPGTVYRGHSSVSDEEVYEIYKNRFVPSCFVEPTADNRRMVQLADTFSKPQMCLLSDVIEWFIQNGINFEPISIYDDVNLAVKRAHPVFHEIAVQNPEKVLDPSQNYGLMTMLTRLRENNKGLFLVTNSPFHVINSGLTFMLGSEWRSFFDIVIIQAKKPRFFSDQTGLFREFSVKRDRLKWHQVMEFKPAKVYSGGTIVDLQRLTGWEGDKVLYFGDHVYADLADLSLNHGWRTGAVIHDLEDEIMKSNDEDFKWMVNWSTMLSVLIEDCQVSAFSNDKKCVEIIEQWKAEFVELKASMKELFNPRFGSVFRTRRNSTFFSKRLFAYSDLYTSKVTNLNDYSINHTFFPRRGALPHEFRSWFN